MDINNGTDFGTVKILTLKGEKGDKGEAGVSGDYSALTNKPSINNVTLSGNKSSGDLGLASYTSIENLQADVGQVQTDIASVQQDLSDVAGDIATIETGDTSSNAYSQGDYLVYQNQLYSVISAIDIGDSFVVDTNIQAVTVSDEILKMGGLQYDSQNVAQTHGQSYDSSQLLVFKGKTMTPANYANSTFLLLLHASATTGRSSIYFVIFPASGTPAIPELSNSDSDYHPTLGTTGSGSVFVRWSSSSITAGVSIHMFKLG